MNGLMHGKRRWAGALVGAIMSVVVVASVAAETTEIMQTITGGEQPTITVGSVSLAPASYSAAEQQSPGLIDYTITAETGTAPGWTVSVQSSDLVYSGAHGGTNIPAANLAVSVADAPVHVSGALIDATNGPFVPVTGATGGLNTPRNVLTSTPGFGDGVYSQNLDLMFTIPGGSKPGNYSGTITFTVAAAP